MISKVFLIQNHLTMSKFSLLNNQKQVSKHDRKQLNKLIEKVSGKVKSIITMKIIT